MAPCYAAGRYVDKCLSIGLTCSLQSPYSGTFLNVTQTNVQQNLGFAFDDGAMLLLYGCTIGHKTLKGFEENNIPCTYYTLSADLAGFALGNEGGSEAVLKTQIML